MCHAETLFLIDDQKSKVFVNDIFCQKPMGSDDNVNCAFSQFFHRLPVFFRRSQTGKHPHFDAVITHSLDKRIVMLARKNRRRHKNSHLLTIHNGFECRTDRDFRLSISDIPADQAVHCLDTFHVFFRIFDRVQLILRLLIRKDLFKFALPNRIFFKCVSLLRLSFCIQIDQFLRDLLDGPFDTRFRLLPLRRIEFV